MKRTFLSFAAATAFVLAGSIAEAGGIETGGGFEADIAGSVGVTLNSNSATSSGAHTGAAGGTGFTTGNGSGSQTSVAKGSAFAANHGSVGLTIENPTVSFEGDDLLDAEVGISTRSSNRSMSRSHGAGSTSGAGNVSEGYAIGWGEGNAIGDSAIDVDIDAFLAGSFTLGGGNPVDVPGSCVATGGTGNCGVGEGLGGGNGTDPEMVGQQ